MKSIIIHTSEFLSQKIDSRSSAGHMWFTLIDKDKRESIGFGPGDKDQSSIFPKKKGHILHGDDIDYLEKWNSNEILIDDDQFDRIKHFVEEVKSNIEDGDGEFSHYNVANQNCVEFVWSALKHAGIVDKKDLLPAHNLIPPIVHDPSSLGLGLGLGLNIANRMPGSQKYSATLLALSEDGMTESAYLEGTTSKDYGQISAKVSTEFAHANGIQDWTTWGKKGFGYWKPFLKYSLRHEDAEALYERMLAVYGKNATELAKDYVKAEAGKNQKLLEILGSNEEEATVAQTILEMNKNHFSDFNAKHPLKENGQISFDESTFTNADFNVWKVVNALSFNGNLDALLGGEEISNPLNGYGYSAANAAFAGTDRDGEGQTLG
jgi:hypothetical protein